MVIEASEDDIEIANCKTDLANMMNMTNMMNEELKTAKTVIATKNNEVVSFKTRLDNVHQQFATARDEIHRQKALIVDLEEKIVSFKAANINEGAELSGDDIEFTDCKADLAYVNTKLTTAKSVIAAKNNEILKQKLLDLFDSANDRFVEQVQTTADNIDVTINVNEHWKNLTQTARKHIVLNRKISTYFFCNTQKC